MPPKQPKFPTLTDHAGYADAKEKLDKLEREKAEALADLTSAKSRVAELMAFWGTADNIDIDAVLAGEEAGEQERLERERETLAERIGLLGQAISQQQNEVDRQRNEATQELLSPLIPEHHKRARRVALAVLELTKANHEVWNLFHQLGTVGGFNAEAVFKTGATCKPGHFDLHNLNSLASAFLLNAIRDGYVEAEEVGPHTNSDSLKEHIEAAARDRAA